MRSVLLALPALLALGSASAEPLELHLNDPIGRTSIPDQCIDDHCKALLRIVSGAQRTIDFAVYGFRNQSAIIQAIYAARDRGVRIRGVIDRTPDGKNYYASTDEVVANLPGMVRDDQQADIKHLESFEPPVTSPGCRAPEGFLGPPSCITLDLGDSCLHAEQAAREAIGAMSPIMHNKFFVVDGRWVWTGSTNVSDSGTGGYNANLVTLIDSEEVASLFTAEFEQMHGEGKFHNQKEAGDPVEVQLDGKTSVTVAFSPQHRPVDRLVRPLLQSAKKRIDVGIFFLTHKGIARDLADAHLRGVKVRVILDATAATNEYSKHEVLRAVGIPIKVETWGGKMHAKSAQIDGETVITGSMNWTSAGNYTNDENTVIVRSRAHARQYTRWFETLWASIDDQYLLHQPDPEGPGTPAACGDGVDNDYDHLADADDPGCGDDPPPLPELPPYRVVMKDDPGAGLVKANVDSKKRRWYVEPGHHLYKDLEIVPKEGDRFFCSAEDARRAGFSEYGRRRNS